VETLKAFHAVDPTLLCRNGHTGWRVLSGVLLCATGTEAMFADIGREFFAPNSQKTTNEDLPMSYKSCAPCSNAIASTAARHGQTDGASL